MRRRGREWRPRRTSPPPPSPAQVQRKTCWAGTCRRFPDTGRTHNLGKKKQNSRRPVDQYDKQGATLHSQHEPTKASFSSFQIRIYFRRIMYTWEGCVRACVRFIPHCLTCFQEGLKSGDRTLLAKLARVRLSAQIHKSTRVNWLPRTTSLLSYHFKDDASF